VSVKIERAVRWMRGNYTCPNRPRHASPILLVTGFSDQVTEERLSDAGVGAFVMKPFMKRQMAKIIRGLGDRTAIGNPRFRSS
jgi:AmiR/NasT family two-component response regulator